MSDPDLPLLTDLYQLTMLQAYWRERMHDSAVFSLFVRRLPKTRNYLVACGLDDALTYLETLRFSDSSLEYLSELPGFTAGFTEWLREFRFTGDVYALPEGSLVFANEPILEVVAPIAEAQLVETYLMNQIHFQTVAASKASRVVQAAAGRAVIDFGLRRMHGIDAGLKAARAFYVAGVAATSNVLAGKRYGIPVSGTMAHSYIQAHAEERDAFREFLALYPDATLLVDTYDTLRAVELVIELAQEIGPDFAARGIRLDSGDLYDLAVRSRAMLDAAGLQRVHIFASGGLDEHEVDRLVRTGAPIDGFGVGTGMGVSRDAPSLDVAYKLTEYAGRGRLKTSPGKPILPGRKQVFRVEEGGHYVRDVIARWDETGPGRPLLQQVMRNGERLQDAADSLDAARTRAAEELARLPDRILSLDPTDPPYPVEISDALIRDQQDLIAELSNQR